MASTKDEIVICVLEYCFQTTYNPILLAYFLDDIHLYSSLFIHTIVTLVFFNLLDRSCLKSTLIKET